MQPTNPTPMGQPSVDTTNAVSASGNAGARAHFKKMAIQAQQLKGAGAFTGGLTTGPQTPRVHNTSGKMAAKGKN